MKLEFERYTKLRNQISLKKKASGKAKFLETHKKGKEAQLYVTQCTQRHWGLEGRRVLRRNRRQPPPAASAATA